MDTELLCLATALLDDLLKVGDQLRLLVDDGVLGDLGLGDRGEHDVVHRVAGDEEDGDVGNAAATHLLFVLSLH